jgi:hypothetical protein
METPRIFISYRKKDINRLNETREIRRILGQFCFETWLDEDLKGGDIWRNEIDEALNWANSFLLVIHSDVHAGNTVLEEIKFALQAVSSGKYKNLVCLIVEDSLDGKYLEQLDDTLKKRFSKDNPPYLHIRHYISKFDPNWLESLEISFNPIIKEQQHKAINDAKKAGAIKLEKAIRIYEAFMYLLRPFSVLDKETKYILRKIRNKIKINVYDERTILRILEDNRIVIKTSNFIWIHDDSFGRKAIKEAFFSNSPLLSLDIIEKISIKKMKSILSSLAEIDKPEVCSKLGDYLKEIKSSIISQNNDQRLQSLELLEKFAFRVPKEALKMVGLFANERMEKGPVKYTVPFAYRGRSYRAVLEKCLDISRQYNLRYGLFEECLELLVKFYQFKLNDKEYEDIRKKAKELIISTADYNLRVIQPEGYPFLGYRFQELFISKIESMVINKDNRIFYLATSIIKKLLHTESEGTYWDDKTFTIKFGPLIYTPRLEKLRKNVIKLIFKRIQVEKDDERKISLVKALASGMRFPTRGRCGDKLEQMIMNDTKRIINFYLKFDFSKTNPAILQEIEKQLTFQKRRYAEYKNNNKELARYLYNKSNCLLNKLRRDNFYKIYRVLVGDEIYLRDSDDDSWEKIQKERRDRINTVVNAINTNNLSEWTKIFHKIANAYNLEQEYIFANFRLLGKLLGKEKPDLTDKIIGILLRQNFILKSFLTDLVLGLRESSKSYLADAWATRWLKSKNFDLIKEIPYTYWLPDGKLVKRNDIKMLEQLTYLNVSRKKRDELDQRIFSVLPWLYKKNPSRLNRIILAILKRIPEDKLTFIAGTLSTARIRKEIEMDKLPKAIFELAIRKYIRKERLDHRDKEFISFYAKYNPLGLIDFFKKRIEIYKRIKKDIFTSRYDAVPYHLEEIGKVLSNHSAYRQVIKKIIYEWVLNEDYLLREEGKHLLFELSPDLNQILKDEMILLIKSKDKKKIIAAVRVLSAYDGSPIIDEVCKEALRVSKGNKDVKGAVATAIDSTGVVTGEFGLRDAYQSRLARIQEWGKDKDQYVRRFAIKFAKSLAIDIDRETKRVTEQEMIRKKGLDM